MRLISRRNLLFALGLLGLCRISSKGASVESISRVDSSNPLPPHCEALSLVWKTQQNEIKALELKHAVTEQKRTKEYVSAEERWWFDTDDRRWGILRPFGPGGVDSTHWFIVTYVVGKDKKLSWQVDTRKQEVSLLKE